MLSKIVLIVLALLATEVRCEIQISMESSEAASYLHFLDSGFGEPFSSRGLRELIEKSPAKSVFTDRKNVEAFQNIKSYLHMGYNFSNEVANRPEGFWGADAFMAIAARHRDLKSFEFNLSAFLPYRGILDYQRLKDKIHPLFLQLLWNPAVAQRPIEEAAIAKFLSESKLSERLKTVKKFYGSSYPENLPFRVALIPIDDRNLKVKHTSAKNLRDVQIVPYLINAGLAENFDVIFHEFCHAIYEAQPNPFKEMINRFFLSSKDPHAVFVLRYLNEALATAIGNGWFAEAISPGSDQKRWYTDENINSLAKAFYPLVTEYLAKRKTMDRAFFEKLLVLARQTLPDGPNAVASNFVALDFVVDPALPRAKSLSGILRSKFRVQNLNTSLTVSQEHLDTFAVPSLRNYLIVSPPDANATKLMEKLLEGSQLKVPSDGSFVLVLPKNNRFLFWTVANSSEEFERQLEAIAELQLLPSEARIL